MACCMKFVLWAAMVVGLLVPTVAVALDLTGKWRFTGLGSTQILQVTQSGSALSFGVFSGAVTPGSPFATYGVSFSAPPVQAGVSGYVTPSENLLNGRAVSTTGLPDVFVSSLIATRCTCDDGNTTGGDGCSAECRIEPCWVCAGDPSVCTPAADGSACDDDSPCTTGATCSAGICGGGGPVAPCVDMGGPWSVHRDVTGVGSFDFEPTFVQRGTDLAVGSFIGTIDPATGAFALRGPNLDLFCPGFDSIAGSVAPDGATYLATGTDFVLDPFAPDQCDPYALVECGSTTLDPPIGACPTTSTTTTSTTTTTTTTVPGNPVCAASPLPGCRLPVESGTAKLVIKKKTPDTGDTVKWKWVKGAATGLGDFGDPPASTDWVACLYDGLGVGRLRLRMPAGGTCGAKPCWKAKGTTGFAYGDKERTPDGVRKLTLASGIAGKAKIALAAKGDDVPLTPALGYGLPVRFQLQGNGQCWEAVYGVAQENTAAQFKAVAD